MKTRTAAFCMMLCLAVSRWAAGAEAMVKIPAYEGTVTSPASDKQQTALLAGGCFWGVQAVFQHVKGVTRAESGYAGGDAQHANYDMVGTGQTGHAETVKVTFDPSVISYAHILQIFFSVAHDPTQLNRQGPDTGTQYRSAVFPLDSEQSRITKDYIAQLNRARVFHAAIVTRVEPGWSFYPAESYHQDFLARNPTHPYIVVNDLPKLTGLKQIFPDDYRSDPVLVRRSTRAK